MSSGGKRPDGAEPRTFRPLPAIESTAPYPCGRSRLENRSSLPRGRARHGRLLPLPHAESRAHRRTRHPLREAHAGPRPAPANALRRPNPPPGVPPTAPFRDPARQCEQQADALNVEISQDRGVYDALAAVDLSHADAATRYWM